MGDAVNDFGIAIILELYRKKLRYKYSLLDKISIKIDAE